MSSSYNCRRECEKRPRCTPTPGLPERCLPGRCLPKRYLPKRTTRVVKCRSPEQPCGERPRCRTIPDTPEPNCSSFDFEGREAVLQAMRSKLEEVEPRLGCVGEKLQRVTDDMQKFREHLTCRRREIEDLEAAVHERIGKTEDQLICQVRDLTECKTSLSADSAVIRQSLTGIVSEIGCLKNYVMDNLRQINKRMERRDQAIDRFRDKMTSQIEKFANLVCARSTAVQDLRYQVDAKFSAVKAALRPPRVCSQPIVVSSCGGPEPGEHLLDMVTMTVRADEGSDDSLEEVREPVVVRRKCCRKRADSAPRQVEVILPVLRKATKIPGLVAQTLPVVKKKPPCQYLRQNSRRAPVLTADAITGKDEVTTNADRLLNQMRKDSKHDI